MKHRLVTLAALALLCAGCTRAPAPRPLVIFHASSLTALLEAVRPEAETRLGTRLVLEASGSQVACRKVTELGRHADLLLLADTKLVAEMLSDVAGWRLDFAADELVLAVGARAPGVDEAEQNWPAVLTRPGVRLGRVDENLGPIGYRTLVAWQLHEDLLGPPGLAGALRGQTEKVVEHVTRLAPLLRTGEIDYGFVYRSLCHAWDLRYIRLDPRVNLGDPAGDYARAATSFRSLEGGGRELTVRGAPIVYTLTAPGPPSEAALAFVRHLVTANRPAMERLALRPLPRPLFYGPRQTYEQFSAFADRAGETP